VRGYVLTRYGDATAMAIREVPVPAAGPGEVLIRVHAAGLNPIDYKIREGKARLVMPLKLPRVAGSELSGVVEAAGPGVTRISEGDRVFARVDKAQLGAFADYVAVGEELVAAMPDGLDFVEGAALPLAGQTALQALRDELGVTPGGRVFISGGAGGVGTLAIQLAKWMGAEVATTASPRGEALVRSLGADHVIDYTRERFRDVLHEYDAALDLVGGDSLTDSFAILKRGATTVSIAGVPEPTTARKDLAGGPCLTALFWLASARVRRRARRHGVGYRFLLMRPSGTDLAVLARLVDERRLKVVIDRTFPFAEIAGAFAYLEQGRAKGKVVVRMV
jgi:NADPH:quinone reductase-like Zn-dependent oxidoreductase